MASPILFGRHEFRLLSFYSRSPWALACLCLLLAGDGFGTEYTLRADANIQQNYNTNILLLPDSIEHAGVWGSELNFQTSIMAANPVWTAKGNARFDNWFYYPDSGLDMQNQYVDAQYAYLTERSLLEFNGGYINDAILSSKADQVQGIVFGRVQREIFNINPSWTYRISEHTKINMIYSYFNSKYPTSLLSPGNTDGIYPNSTSNSVSTGFNHLFNEYLSFDGMLLATEFVTQDRSIDYVNLTVGCKYLPLINTEVSLSGGGQYSQTTTKYNLFGQFYSLQTNQLTPLFNISLKQNFDKSSLVLSYSQQSTPSINSNLFRSDLVSLSASHRFTQLLDGTLSLSYYSISTSSQNQSSLGQNSYQLGGGLFYNMTGNTVISASYNFQARDIDTDIGAYSHPQYAHIVSINIRHEFDKLHY